MPTADILIIEDDAKIARLIELCTDENDIVLDFFVGSGTTKNPARLLFKRNNQSFDW